jgi:phospholipid-binding lipoprotein MlaA
MSARRLAPWSGLVRALLLAAVVAVSGCATVPTDSGRPRIANPADPWENWNRKVFAFNDAIDEAVLKPVATAYRDVVPALVRRGVDNFFGNIGDLWSAANHLLQGKLEPGLEMGMRVAVNTVFGIYGVLDPASEMRLTRRSEDFGQTLAVWGLGNGPYVVLPLFGPSTLRDTAAFPLDRYATSSTVYYGDINGYLVTPLQVVAVRADLLATTQLLGEVALDRYSFVRDSYLSRRLDQIYDGAPPLETFDDEPAEPANKKP